jgi:hypothetical protein
MTQVVRVAILVAIALVGLNGAFIFLSDWYYDGKPLGPTDLVDRVDHVRIAFAIFTGAVGVAIIAASSSPRIIGHVIAVVLGLASISAAFAAYGRGITPVLPTTLLLIGVLLPMLAFFSFQQRSRAAWSFLTSLCGVYGTVLLFGAPKVRGLLDIGLWTALIIPGLLAVATGALAMLRPNYRETAG